MSQFVPASIPTNTEALKSSVNTLSSKFTSSTNIANSLDPGGGGGGGGGGGSGNGGGPNNKPLDQTQINNMKNKDWKNEEVRGTVVCVVVVTEG